MWAYVPHPHSSSLGFALLGKRLIFIHELEHLALSAESSRWTRTVASAQRTRGCKKCRRCRRRHRRRCWRRLRPRQNSVDISAKAHSMEIFFAGTQTPIRHWQSTVGEHTRTPFLDRWMSTVCVEDGYDARRETLGAKIFSFCCPDTSLWLCRHNDYYVMPAYLCIANGKSSHNNKFGPNGILFVFLWSHFHHIASVERLTPLSICSTLCIPNPAHIIVWRRQAYFDVLDLVTAEVDVMRPQQYYPHESRIKWKRSSNEFIITILLDKLTSRMAHATTQNVAS